MLRHGPLRSLAATARSAKQNSFATTRKVSRSFGQGRGPSPTVEDLKKAGIQFIPRFAGFEICENKICAVTADARASFDILYPALGCKVESNLAAELGAR
jgi:hypothetical protein